jgi:Mg-chelatase subunit ChlD
LVLLTIGGNDVGFADIIRECFAPGFRDGPTCDQKISDAVGAAGDLTGTVEGILVALRARMKPEGRVVLLAYPYLELNPGFMLEGYPVGQDIRDLGDDGDAAQLAAVSEHNTAVGSNVAVFIDGVKDHFAGHEPDGRWSVFGLGKVNPDRWLWEWERFSIPENYHPNPTGHQEYANLLIPYATFGTGGVFLGGDVDVVFVVDTTGSMWDDIDAVKDFASDFVDLLTMSTSSFRFALVTYRDHPEHTEDPEDYPARVDLDFTDDEGTILTAIDAMEVDGGGDLPESVYSGLLAGIGLEWRPGVKKVVIQLGDAGPHDPEPVTGYTASDVIEAAWAVDPAEVYVVDVSSVGVDPLLEEIADETGGGVFTAATPEDIAEALVEVIEEALAKPTAWAGGPYVTVAGTQIILDGSGSFDADGTIVSYEWDLDGDGTFDTSSSEPTYAYTFTSDFDGHIALRVTDNVGLKSIATVLAHASNDGDEVPYDEDNCPDDPNHGQEDFDEDGIGDVCDPDPGFVVETEGTSAGVGYVSLPGVEGDWVEAPDDNPMDVTGDLDVRMLVEFDDVSEARFMVLANKGHTWSESDSSWEFWKRASPSSQAGFAWRDASGTRTAMYSWGSGDYLVDGPRWYRVTLEVDNGSGEHVVTFWYSDDPPDTDPGQVSWTEQSHNDLSGTTSVRASTAPVRLGESDEEDEFFAGNLFYFELRDGISGTVVANPDFRTTDQLTSTPPDFSEWEDDHENPWTMVGTGWTYIPPEGEPEPDPDPEPGRVVLDGTEGTRIEAPDVSTLDITGDLDIRILARLDDLDSNYEPLVSKSWEQYQFMRHSSGTAGWFEWSTTGNSWNGQASSSGLFTTGVRWYRVTHDVDNGSSQNVVAFWYSDDPADTDPGEVSWTLHSSHTRSGTSSHANTSHDLWIGAEPLDDEDPLQGEVYYVEVRDGIGGTVVANPDFRTVGQLVSTPPDYSGWEDDYDNPWTMIGTGWTYPIS